MPANIKINMIFETFFDRQIYKCDASKLKLLKSQRSSYKKVWIFQGFHQHQPNVYVFMVDLWLKKNLSSLDGINKFNLQRRSSY